MSNIIQISDFDEGRFEISYNSFQEADLQSFIDLNEVEYLANLLGAELYDLFIADLSAGVPQTQRFIDIYEAFLLQDECDLCQSRGMKEMLKSFIYFHYVRDTYTRQTTNGVKQTTGENSVSLETVAHDFTSKYNKGVDTYRCIQKKICENLDDYPEYKGIKLDYILPI